MSAMRQHSLVPTPVRPRMVVRSFYALSSFPTIGRSAISTRREAEAPAIGRDAYDEVVGGRAKKLG